ncbi:MAG: hypothetical protein AVDCRST_MAG18-2836, partial [uncultured Thermomicrobiales bacterium]
AWRDGARGAARVGRPPGDDRLRAPRAGLRRVPPRHPVPARECASHAIHLAPRRAPRAGTRPPDPATRAAGPARRARARPGHHRRAPRPAEYRASGALCLRGDDGGL